MPRLKRTSKELKKAQQRANNLYGKDSNAYEQAGGVRKSERKKPERKPKSI